MKFHSKAENLAVARDALPQCNILPVLYFCVHDWHAHAFTLEDRMSSVFGESWQALKFVVRSSAQDEDNSASSLAGKYKSLLDVSAGSCLVSAIDEVTASMGEDGRNQILIQPMLRNVTFCGVVFTREQSTGADYFVLNYDNSGRTDAVTSGSTNKVITEYYTKDSRNMPDDWRLQLIQLLSELEAFFGTTALDVEFAYCESENRVYILQVRPLVVPLPSNCLKGDLQKLRKQIAHKIDVLCNRHPYLYGEQGLFGIMPDWNPAEIIGVKPKPLALSLYKELITDSIWAYQRNNYGYQNLRSFPLLVSFGGLPYIDVRVSFNSFIPKDIPPELGERLVNYYLSQLSENPGNHDKVEFEVVFSCYSLDFEKRKRALLDYGFTESDCSVLSTSLKSLTNSIIDPHTGLWIQDFNKLEKLRKRQLEIRHSIDDLPQRIYWQLEDCKRYGTLPFAGLARAGFIAVQMLDSLVAENVLTDSDRQNFMASLTTVSGQMTSDFNFMSRSEFLGKYGHLRPGTYEITSKRYDANPELYFNWGQRLLEEKKITFNLSQLNYRRCQSILEKHGIRHTVDSLFHFIKSAIEGREYAKFIFTRSLSNALEDIALLCEKNGISREDAAFLDFNIVKTFVSTTGDLTQDLNASVRQGKHNYELTKSLFLPPLISKEIDVNGFVMPAALPNFITNKKVVGETSTADEKSVLKDKIVFIVSADPGFDWLFSHSIGGLITMYGGVNSHMAIRAGEMGIPAVIGAGERFFQEWKSFSIIELDAENKQIRLIRK